MKFKKTNKVGKFEVKKVKNKGAVSKNAVRVAITPRSKRDLAELENYLWAQVQSKSSKKKMLSIRARNATDGNWQNRLCRFHPPFYILVCFSSFLRQRRHALLKVGLKSSFFDTFGYIVRCSQKDLWSSFWWDEFEVEFWACVYLKTSAKHLQCREEAKCLWTPYYRKRGSASYSEVHSVREREREIQRERERRKWRHHCRAKIGDEFCTSPCQKYAP